MIRALTSCVWLNLLLLGCGGASEQAEPAPVAESGASNESAVEDETAAEDAPEAAAAPSHEQALALLQDNPLRVADAPSQDCVEDGSEVTVAQMAEESARDAETQSTECTATDGGFSCTSSFTNNSGNEDEEFYLRLEYRVSGDGSALTELVGCVFAG